MVWTWPAHAVVIGSMFTYVGSVLTYVGSVFSYLSSVLTYVGSVLTYVGSVLTYVWSVLNYVESMFTYVQTMLTCVGTKFTDDGTRFTYVGTKLNLCWVNIDWPGVVVLAGNTAYCYAVTKTLSLNSSLMLRSSTSVVVYISRDFSTVANLWKKLLEVNALTTSFQSVLIH